MPAHGFFPTPLGATWTYRDDFPRHDGQPATPTVVTVCECDPERLLHFADPEGPNGVSEKQAGGAAVLTVNPGGRLPEMVVAAGVDGLEVYVNEPSMPMFMAAWKIPENLSTGARWTSNEVRFSCGWGVWEQSCEAHAERITVPAGSFETLRIDGASYNGPHTIWLAAGLGPVRFGVGDYAIELAASSLLAG